MTTCNVCQGTGFKNLEQIDEDTVDLAECSNDFHEYIIEWIGQNEEHDVEICTCCGDGEGWHGIPGSHYIGGDDIGPSGPYAYNGGLCECH